MDTSNENSYCFQYENDKFANFIGIKLIEFSHGNAVATLEVGEKLTNGVQLAHGGAVFTLADLAFAAASNCSGVPAVAINATINYVKAVRAGLLTATAKELSSTRKIATYSVEVTDAQNDLVATFLGTAYKKPFNQDNSENQ